MYVLTDCFVCHVNFNCLSYRMNHEGSIVQEDGEISPPGEQYHVAPETRREKILTQIKTLAGDKPTQSLVLA